MVTGCSELRLSRDFSSLLLLRTLCSQRVLHTDELATERGVTDYFLTLLSQMYLKNNLHKQIKYLLV